MSQKSNEKKFPAKKKTTTWNAAMTFFLAGCFGEIYLLALRKFYVHGDLQQVVTWDSYVRIFLLSGAALLAVGLAALAVWRKAEGWRGVVGWIAAGAGAFLALSSWLCQTYYETIITPLCVAVPALMLLGILWSLYDRECAWALTILGCDLAALWICRRGLSSPLWRVPVLIGAAAAIALSAAAVLLARRADGNRGMLGTLRVIEPNGDPLAIYVAGSVSVVSLILAVCSTALAYYAIWAVALVVFAIAAYYTVKQL